MEEPLCFPPFFLHLWQSYDEHLTNLHNIICGSHSLSPTSSSTKYIHFLFSHSQLKIRIYLNIKIRVIYFDEHLELRRRENLLIL